MLIKIDNKSNEPIYRQLYDALKNAVISGELAEDEPLPSIRAIAKDLRISVITSKRAYDELERDGFIYTVAAKGCFVAAKNTELIREENMKKIEEHLASAISLARRCGIEYSELNDIMKLLEESE